MNTRIAKTLLQKGGFGLLFALACLSLAACKEWADTFAKDDCQAVDVSKTKVTVPIVRLEDELIQLKSKEEAQAFLAKYPALAKQFFLEDKYPPGILAENLAHLAQDTAIRTIYDQTKQVYPHVSDLQQQFEDAFAHIKHYYPDFKTPKVYTTITGLGIETFVSDSIIVLSLDYFLGEKAKYKPRDPSGQPFPEYLLKRYQKEYIVPACMLYISNKYNKVDMLDNTLLAEMVYYGKAYHFAKKMLPCTPDTLIIGYSGIQLKDAKAHEQVIWSFFIEHKVLYETSHFIKTKYTGERPYTAEIGPKCPGKIGTWLGWLIVDAYAQHNPQITFQQLMEIKDSKKLFLESKYKPNEK